MNIFSILNNPRSIIIVILLFFTIYFIIGDKTGTFNSTFLRFGPNKHSKSTDGTNTNKDTKYIGISINSWSRVIMVYFITFFSALLNAYYNTTVSISNNIIFNDKMTTIKYNKYWTYIAYILDPMFIVLFTVLQFFATATFELQYIIPQFLGIALIRIPYSISFLNKHKFITI